MKRKKLLVLAGDGIGPEVTAETLRVLDWFKQNRPVELDVVEGLLGGCAIDRFGEPVTDETVALAETCDAILVGAVGGAAWDGVEFSKRPEQGLLRLRKHFELFANIRPAKCFTALVDHSTLKREVIDGLDIVIVRELTSGLYFGEPRGIFEDSDGRRRGVNTQDYSAEEVARVARSAFRLAKGRSNRLCSMEKSNVMESGALWREVVQQIGDDEFPEVELTHMYADNGAMQLVRDPKQFDVIVTDNLFGDILSDEAAMLTGSLGMLPSASLGHATESAASMGLYEPVHGSAPDIAGKNVANPMATILSLGMSFRYSFDLAAEADRLEHAVEAVLAKGVRTADLMHNFEGSPATTREVGDAIIGELEQM